MAHHQHVDMHGVQRHRGVDQGLALLDRARGDRHVDDVGTQPLARQLERGAGACRVLEEQVDHRAAAQVDPWEFEVYPYVTEGRGVAELETDNAVVTNGHSRGGDGTAAGTFPSQAMWYNQYELTYGLTDRIEAAAYLNLARVYNAQHASDKALEALRAALPEGKEFPVSEYYQELEADVATERGAAYTAKKMYALAIDEYARALDFDPRRAVVHRRLAELYLRKGDPAGAALHTKEADKLEKGQR